MLAKSEDQVVHEKLSFWRFHKIGAATNITSMWKSEVQGHKYNIISGTSAEVQITLVKVPIGIKLDQTK